jgi:valyl-tRNA synthetase
MYHLDYGTLTIATTRPETIFADVAIAVYPDDKRYKKLIGKTATIPLIGKEIPIIADELVDPKFGTGALKITPGHDPTDFEIGKKHDLPVISVINKKGKMTNVPKKYDGLDVKKARHAVEKDLEEGGFLKKKKKISHTVGVCYRDKGIIEPLVTKQWYLKVDPLVKKSVKAIKEKRIKFAAQHFKKIALHWYKNLHDWNISRQIVWGIRIPAWKCKECNKWVVTDGATPNNCPHCNGEKLVQDTDTFDTWFSSGQWPYATLMTTKKGDYKRFYPTSVMETGYDILPFWVIRMIMLGLYEKDEVPFKTVLLHGLVRDENGEKISKSKGNVIDPVKMIEKYGADALRMGIIWGSLVENDISLSEDNIKAQRNFANKIWNVARFVFMEDTNLQSTNKNKDDKDILNELKKTVALVTKLTNDYRLNEAAEELYNFIWNKFANEYLEKTKSRRKDAQPTLEHVLQESLKLLHPFMPFVTEAIWQEGKSRFDSPTLIKAKWPSH